MQKQDLKNLLENIYHLLAEEDVPPMLTPEDPNWSPLQPPPPPPPWLSPIAPLDPWWPTDKPINWPPMYPYPPIPGRGFGGHRGFFRNPWTPGNQWPIGFPPVQPPGGGGSFFGAWPYWYWLSDSGQIHVWNHDTGTWDVYRANRPSEIPPQQAPWWQFW